MQGFALAKQMLFHFSHTCNLFCSGYFWRLGLKNYFYSWTQTVILSISASQLAFFIVLKYNM
jgi:hypothetical protein